mgnify:CR=1 FL=1
MLFRSMAGYIATATGSYRGALLVAAVVMLAGMGFLMAVGRRERSERG